MVAPKTVESCIGYASHVGFAAAFHKGLST
jgi:hypothetical protein